MKIIESNNRPLILGIDFDDTVVENAFPDIGSLKPNAKEVINKLHDEGYYIIIWTCRYLASEMSAMIRFLNDNDIHYDMINDNYPLLEFKPWPKIFYDILIDDRNLGGIPDWETIYKMVKIFSEEK
jgi:hydroxymethylpyrimidine pyrophosphatase-like HAD family hydrolase